MRNAVLIPQKSKAQVDAVGLDNDSFAVLHGHSLDEDRRPRVPYIGRISMVCPALLESWRFKREVATLP